MGGGSSAPEPEDLVFDDRTDEDRPDAEPDRAPPGWDGIDKNQPSASVFNVDDVVSKYDEIKQWILDENSRSEKQFVYADEIFPPQPKSLYFSPRPPHQWDRIEWKRPAEISSDPHLLKDGVSSEDVMQGILGDCWFLASCGAISRSRELLRKVVPDGQQMRGQDYVGAFHFRFWRFGDWLDVVVDDLLPTSGGRLCFARSRDPNEFWIALLEKAYAKIHGSYESLKGGLTQDSLTDLTGGTCVHYNLGTETPRNLSRVLVRALRNNTLVCGGIHGDAEVNAVDPRTGLVGGHAYSVLKIATVYQLNGEAVQLLKIRNPWGGRKEWIGPWSDGSREWDEIGADERRRIGYEDDGDGEWWMTFNHFVTFFSDVTLCTIGPDFDADGRPTGDRWLLSTIYGGWAPEATAGGSRNDLALYATNPQYLFELSEPDDVSDDDDEEGRGKCAVIVGLMQEYRRAGRADGLTDLFLACNIYRVDEGIRGGRRLTDYYFRRHREVAGTGQYVNRREVSLTAQLVPGLYVIVPSTFHPRQAGTFLIRIFTEKPVALEFLR